MKRRDLGWAACLLVIGWPPLVKQLAKAIEAAVDAFLAVLEWIAREVWPS